MSQRIILTPGQMTVVDKISQPGNILVLLLAGARQCAIIDAVRNWSDLPIRLTAPTSCAVEHNNSNEKMTILEVFFWFAGQPYVLVRRQPVERLAIDEIGE